MITETPGPVTILTRRQRDSLRAKVPPKTWEELTTRQREVLQTFVDITIENGMPPTIRELIARLSIKSPNGMMCHLRSICHYGWMECFDVQTARAWRLTPLALNHFRTVQVADGKVVLNLLTPQVSLTADEARKLALMLHRAARNAEGRKS